jgi:large subunit ribosomal protein L9
MKVILKQDIKGVGRKFDVKDVSDGYANNFLIPKKLAVHASPEAVKNAKIQQETSIAEIAIKESLAKKQIEMLKDVKVAISKKANEKGHLFEKIHNEEIINALQKQAKINIDVDHLVVEEPIKEIGEHQIKVVVGENKGYFTLVVEGFK